MTFEATLVRSVMHAYFDGTSVVRDESVQAVITIAETFREYSSSQYIIAGNWRVLKGSPCVSSSEVPND